MQLGGGGLSSPNYSRVPSAHPRAVEIKKGESLDLTWGKCKIWLFLQKNLNFRISIKKNYGYIFTHIKSP